MNFEPPTQPTPEQEKSKEVLDDNARKFVAEVIDATFLEENGVTSYTMITDWLATGEDNETKVVYKKFDSGDVQILLISKVTKDGSRTSEKEKISEEKYKELLDSSIVHSEKRRHEFNYTQNDTVFSVKYDELVGSKLRMLEVDALSEEERDSFNPSDFPGKLSEVTGDMRYYGYRIAEIV